MLTTAAVALAAGVMLAPVGCVSPDLAPELAGPPELGPRPGESPRQREMLRRLAAVEDDDIPAGRYEIAVGSLKKVIDELRPGGIATGPVAEEGWEPECRQRARFWLAWSLFLSSARQDAARECRTLLRESPDGPWSAHARLLLNRLGPQPEMPQAPAAATTSAEPGETTAPVSAPVPSPANGTSTPPAAPAGGSGNH
jgi:hypothetical protein